MAQSAAKEAGIEFGTRGVDSRAAQEGDLRLRPPPEDTTTQQVLSGSRVAPCEIRVGLSTWGDAAYRSTIFPARTRPAQALSAYGRILATVELSATFYSLPPPERLRAWHDAVPPSFRFMPKAPQTVTHRGSPDTDAARLEAFDERLALLGDRRGPTLLQWPPHFAPIERNVHRLRRAVAALRTPVAVELRHPGWFRGSRPPAATLAGCGCSLVITDTVGARDVVHSILTAPEVVLRFVALGQPEIDAARLAAWCERIRQWVDRGLERAYVFIHLDDPWGAIELVHRASRACTPTGALVTSPDPLPRPATGSTEPTQLELL